MIQDSPTFSTTPAASSRHLMPYAVALAGVLTFVAIGALVQVHALVGIDLAVTQAKQPFNNAFLDGVGQIIAILVSGEVSLLYAGVATVLLWRVGVGRWSLAPFAFLLLEPVEFILKTVIQQPPPPSEFYRGIYYPLTNVVLSGAFPSGHAMRSGFLCMFAVILWRTRRGWLATIGPIVCALFALLAAASRVYLGYHWASDVIASLALGAALAIVVALPIVEKPGFGCRDDNRKDSDGRRKAPRLQIADERITM